MALNKRNGKKVKPPYLQDGFWERPENKLKTPKDKKEKQ